MKNRRSLVLAALSMPLVFIAAGEFTYDHFNSNRAAAIAIAGVLTLLVGAVVAWWNTATSENRVLPLESPRSREAAKRFGLVAGFVSAPVATTVVVQGNPPAKPTQ